MSYNLILTKYLNRNNSTAATTICGTPIVNARMPKQNPFSTSSGCCCGQGTNSQPVILVNGGFGYSDLARVGQTTQTSQYSSSKWELAAILLKGLARAGYSFANFIYTQKGYPDNMVTYNEYSPQRSQQTKSQSYIVFSSKTLCSCNSPYALQRYVPQSSSYASNLDLFVPFTGYRTNSSGYGATIRPYPTSVLDYPTVSSAAQDLNFSSAGMYNFMNGIY